MPNLLQKASIVLTPTAYDDGKVLCAKPSEPPYGDFDFSRNSAATRVNAQGLVENVQTLSGNLVQNGDFSELGSEQIVNGNFETNSSWDGNFTIANGQLTKNDTGLVRQYTLDVSVKSYKVVVDVETIGASLTIYLGGTQQILSQGINTIYMQSGGSNSLVGFNNGNGAVINSFSVKELGQNWDLGTGWSIGNNVAISDATQGYIVQTDVGGAGVTATYKIQWEQNITAGTRLRFFARNYNDGGNATILSITRDDGLIIGGGNCIGSGTFTAYVSSTNGYSFKLLAEAGVEADITNITTIQITTDTNLPRINYEGFSYQDALGSELVVNGGFENGGSNWVNINNAAVFENSSVIFENNARIYQNVVSDLSKEYNIEIEFSNISGNGIQLLAGNGNSFVSYSVSDIINNGNKINIAKESFIGSGILFIYSQNSDTSATITNVSVKEYLGQEVVPDSGCGSWLFEPQSTNHCLFSEQPSVWHSSSNVTITANAETSPQGISNASTVVNTTTNAFVRNIFYFSSSAATLDVTTSFFIKYTNNQWVYLRPLFFNGGSSSRTWFDIQNGVLGTNNNVSSSIKDFGNGWYRCSVTHQIAPATDTTGYVQIYACDNDNSTTQVIGQGFAAFGSQGEEFSYATSYIPTSGTTVTRNQDVCTNGGSLASINSTEGVLYAEIAALTNDATRRTITISDGTTSNRIVLRYDNASNRIQGFIQVGGSTNGNINTTSFTITNFLKIAYTGKAGDFALWVNGTEVGTSTDATSFAPDVLEVVEFNFPFAQSFFGKTKALAVWKEALSDEELTELTTT